MTKNLILGPILTHLTHILDPKFSIFIFIFLFIYLFIYLQFLPLLVVRLCSKLSSYAI